MLPIFSRNETVVELLWPLIADTLRENPQQFPGVGGPSLLAIKPVRGSSIHYVADVEMGARGCPTPYFVKANKPNYRGPQSLRIESDILKTITPKLAEQNPALRSPRVLAYAPGRELLLMEKVPGKSLKALLSDLSGGFSLRLPHLLRLSGEWLGRFHTLTQKSDLGSPVEWLFQLFRKPKVRTAFEACSQLEAYSELLKLIYRFRELRPSLTRHLCQVHAEFTPLHVIVQENAVCVIDFASSHLGFVYEDLALFNAFYDGLLPWRIITGSQRLTFASQKELFNKAYARHAPWKFAQDDHLLMRFSQLAALAEIEASWEMEPAGWRNVMYSRVARAWLRKRFPRIVRRELKTLQQSLNQLT